MTPKPPTVRTPLLICHERKLLFIYCFTATEMTKMRFKRHIAKVYYITIKVSLDYIRKLDGTDETLEIFASSKKGRTKGVSF